MYISYTYALYEGKVALTFLLQTVGLWNSDMQYRSCTLFRMIDE